MRYDFTWVDEELRPEVDRVGAYVITDFSEPCNHSRVIVGVSGGPDPAWVDEPIAPVVTWAIRAGIAMLGGCAGQPEKGDPWAELRFNGLEQVARFLAAAFGADIGQGSLLDYALGHASYAPENRERRWRIEVPIVWAYRGDEDEPCFEFDCSLRIPPPDLVWLGQIKVEKRSLAKIPSRGSRRSLRAVRNIDLAAEIAKLPDDPQLLARSSGLPSLDQLLREQELRDQLRDTSESFWPQAG